MNMKRSNSFGAIDLDTVDAVEINAFTLGNIFNELICENDNVLGILLGTKKTLASKKIYTDDTTAGGYNGDKAGSSPRKKRAEQADRSISSDEENTQYTHNQSNSSSPQSPRSRHGSFTSSNNSIFSVPKSIAIVQAMEIIDENNLIDPATGAVNSNIVDKLKRKYSEILNMEVLGWFRFRPHTRLQPTFLDATVHRQFVKMFNSVSLLFSMFSIEQKPNKEALFSVRFRFLKLSKGEVRSMETKSNPKRNSSDEDHTIFLKPLVAVPHTIVNYVNDKAEELQYQPLQRSIYTHQVPHTNKMETIIHKTLKSSRLLEEYTTTLVNDMKNSYMHLRDSERKIRNKQLHIQQLQQQLSQLREQRQK